MVGKSDYRLETQKIKTGFSIEVMLLGGADMLGKEVISEVFMTQKHKISGVIFRIEEVTYFML